MGRYDLGDQLWHEPTADTCNANYQRVYAACNGDPCRYSWMKRNCPKTCTGKGSDTDKTQSVYVRECPTTKRVDQGCKACRKKCGCICLPSDNCGEKTKQSGTRIVESKVCGKPSKKYGSKSKMA